MNVKIDVKSNNISSACVVLDKFIPNRLGDNLIKNEILMNALNFELIPLCRNCLYKKVATILAEVAAYCIYCHLKILYANKIISWACIPFILRDLSMRSPLNFHQQTNIFHTIDQLKMVTLSTHCKTALSFFPRHLDNM